MEIEVRKPNLRVEGVEHEFVQFVFPRTVWGQISNPVLTRSFSRHDGAMVPRTNIRGKCVLEKNRVSVAGTAHPISTSLECMITPGDDWGGIIGCVPEDREMNREPEYFLELTVPSEAYSQIEAALTYSHVQKISLGMDFRDMWVHEGDRYAEHRDTLTWHLGPGERGMSDVHLVELNDFGWFVGAQA